MSAKRSAQNSTYAIHKSSQSKVHTKLVLLLDLLYFPEESKKMALLQKSRLLNPRILMGLLTKSRGMGHYVTPKPWNYLWKPGPYPRTEEERIAAAKKVHSNKSMSEIDFIVYKVFFVVYEHFIKTKVVKFFLHNYHSFHHYEISQLVSIRSGQISFRS